ncbi:LUD domain-containing protein [Haloarcula marina]|uniref:LUD domain-containing protein n=1 Tax=Haloarcula marina TaxID=2961574 RepID=UPI0020B7BFC7|nr:LUD domain-containing protein [Halomicroarcula marina]
MATDTLGAFESSLSAYDVPVTTVSQTGFAAAVDEAVDPPAVGVALDGQFDGRDFSLDDTAVSVDPTPVELREATTGVTAAAFGVGDYGTLSLRLTDRGSELVSLFVDHHVVVLREEDVLATMDDAIAAVDADLRETRGSTIFATGPSATADMGALVRGAHGPKSVAVLLVEAE